MKWEQFFNSAVSHQASPSFIFSDFIFGLLLTAIFAHLLKLIYERCSNAVDRLAISKLLPPMALTAFVIVFVIKSSLAISLGLLGALAIVRFRTPIKSAEDLVYIFISVVIGIGFAAGHLLAGAVGIFFVFISLFMYRKWRPRNYRSGHTCIIQLPPDANEIIPQIQSIFLIDGGKFKIQRINITNSGTELSIFFWSKDNEILTIKNKLCSLLPNSDISFFARNDLP